MRLLSALAALAACQLGMTFADLHHEKIQRSLQARTWAHETRGLLDLFGDLNTCAGCQVCPRCVFVCMLWWLAADG
jgi:ferredoxin